MCIIIQVCYFLGAKRNGNTMLHNYHSGFYDRKKKEWTCCKQEQCSVKGCKPVESCPPVQHSKGSGVVVAILNRTVVSTKFVCIAVEIKRQAFE